MAAIALLGSGEFEAWARGIDTWCAERATASSDRALIFPTASAPEGEEVFQRWGAMGTAHYRACGMAPEVVPLRTRADASDPAIVDAVADARLLFFSGGNPGYLAEVVEDTPFWEAVLDAIAHGTALGGCSAGAAFLGSKVPYVTDEMLERWIPGTRLLEHAFVAPHFDMLDSYMDGLRDLVIDERPDGSTLVGLDEHTALLGDGETWSVTGRGAAWLAEPDTRELRPFRDGEPVHARLGLRAR